MWVIPTKTIDCWVTLRGAPDLSGKVQKLATLSWRPDSFIVQGYDTNFDPEYIEDFAEYSNTSIQQMRGCQKGYIEIYNTDLDGNILDPAVIGPVCGDNVPVDFTTSSNIIIVHLHIQAPPTNTYTLLNGSMIAADTTCGVNATKAQCVRREKRYGPFITFKADFTSYFEGKVQMI